MRTIIIILLVYLGYIVIAKQVLWRNSHNSIFFYDNSSLGQENLIYHGNLASLVENGNDPRLKDDAPSLHTVIISAINQTIPDWMYKHIRKCKKVIINGGYNSNVLEFIKKWPSMEILEMRERSGNTENLHLGFIEALKETMTKNSLNIKIKALSISMLECDDEIMKAFSDIILDRGLKIEGVSFGFSGCSDFALSKIFETLESPFLQSFHLGCHRFGENPLSHYLKETLTKSPVMFFIMDSGDYFLSEDDVKELGPIFTSSQLVTVKFQIRDMFGFTGPMDNNFLQNINVFSNSMKDSLILDFGIRVQRNDQNHFISILTRENRMETIKQSQIFMDLKFNYLLQDFESVIDLAYRTDNSFREKRIVGWTADAVALAKKNYALKAFKNEDNVGRVDVSNMDLTDDELESIVKDLTGTMRMKGVKRIYFLNLRKNRLTKKTITILMKRFRILRLDLSSNCVGDDGLQLLSRFIPGSHLISLDLSHNRISDWGVTELARNLFFGNRLRSLVLSHNAIGDAGLGSLAKSLTKSPLESLVLDGCSKIGHSGLQELAASIPQSQLRQLQIISTRFNSEILDQLMVSFNNSQMTKFSFEHMDVMDEGSYYLKSMRNIFDRNAEKYDKYFESIRDSFYQRSFENVIKLAEKDGARVVGWVKEIVTASREYLKIADLQKSRSILLRKSPSNIHEEVPIVEEDLLIK